MNNQCDNDKWSPSAREAADRIESGDAQRGFEILRDTADFLMNKREVNGPKEIADKIRVESVKELIFDTSCYLQGIGQRYLVMTPRKDASEKME